MPYEYIQQGEEIIAVWVPDPAPAPTLSSAPPPSGLSAAPAPSGLSAEPAPVFAPSPAPLSFMQQGEEIIPAPVPGYMVSPFLADTSPPATLEQQAEEYGWTPDYYAGQQELAAVRSGAPFVLAPSGSGALPSLSVDPGAATGRLPDYTVSPFLADTSAPSSLADQAEKYGWTPEYYQTQIDLEAIRDLMATQGAGYMVTGPASLESGADTSAYLPGMMYDKGIAPTQGVLNSYKLITGMDWKPGDRIDSYDPTTGQYTIKDAGGNFVQSSPGEGGGAYAIDPNSAAGRDILNRGLPKPAVEAIDLARDVLGKEETSTQAGTPSASSTNASSTTSGLTEEQIRQIASLPPGGTLEINGVIYQPVFTEQGEGETKQIGPLERIIAYKPGETDIGKQYAMLDPTGEFEGTGQFKEAGNAWKQLAPLALQGLALINPALAPFVNAARGIMAATQGNPLGALASFAGAAQGFGVNLPSGTADVFRFANAAQAVKNGDPLTAISMLVDSKDVRVALAARDMVEAVKTGNPLAILNASSGLGNALNSASGAPPSAPTGQQGGQPAGQTGTPGGVTGVRFSGGDELAFQAYQNAISAGMSSDEAMAVASFLTSPQGTSAYQDTLRATGDTTAALNAAVDASGRAGTQGIRTGTTTGIDLGTLDKPVDTEFGNLALAEKEAAARNTVNISNAEANTVEEAAALARIRNPDATSFTFGGQTYTRSATTEQVSRQIGLQEIKEAPTFNEAFSKARTLLGPNQTFEWQGKQYNTATFAERPDLAGTSVVPGATSTTAGAGRGSYAGFDPVAAAEAASKTPISSTISDKGPTIFGIPIGTVDDAIRSTKRIGEVVADFSKGIGEGSGNFIKFFGDLGHIASTSLAGGDPKDASITKDNLLSSVGKNIGDYYRGLTSKESNDQWKRFTSDVAAAPDYLKPFVAVGSALQNFGGVVNRVGVEAGEDVAPILAGLGVGSKILQLGATGTARTVAVTATLGDMAESMTGSYNTVMDRLASNKNMTDAEKHWAATQAGAASMAATAVFGYGANAYLAKSLVGDFVENATKKVMGNAYVEYATEFPETLIQSLSETYAVNGKITPQDITRANTDASISALIGAKTAGSIVGSAEVMGQINNEFVGAGDGDRRGLAIIQNTQGQVAFVPAGDLKVGDRVDAESVTQLQTPADFVSQFNFAPEEASRVISSVEQLDSTRDARKEQTEIERQEFEALAAESAAREGQTTPGTQTNVTTDPQTGVTTQTATDPNTGVNTQTTTDPNTGVNTQTTTNPNTGVNTQTTTNTNTGVNTQTQTNTNTGVTTETTTDPNTGVNTQTTTDPNTNVNTQTTVNTQTNVTTQVTTDVNANTETTVNTNPTDNIQVTTVVNVNTGEVIKETVTKVPDDWEPPVIEIPKEEKVVEKPGETLPPGELPSIKTETTTAKPPSQPRTPSTPTIQGGGFFSGQLMPFAPVQFPGLNIPVFEPEASKFYQERKIDPLEQVMQAQADILREPQMPQFGQPVPQPQQQQMSPLDVLRNMQTSQPQIDQPRENPYYAYGSEQSIDDILGGGTLNMAAGGYVAPLMAQGGMTLPLMAKRGGALDHYEGRENFKEGKHVAGEGDGQSDDIPAWLADGEFVFPADVVSALGNGSTKAGTDKLYEMMHNIRERARSKGPKDLPPPALKSPLDYLKSGKGAR